MPLPIQLLRGRPPRFDLRSIKNRRFMWCPRTGELILGGDDVCVSSHAQEHGESDAKAPFGEFVRGWVGFGGSYQSGIIHFAPPFPERMTAADFNDLCSTISLFTANGATGQTILRGAGAGRFELALGVAYPRLATSYVRDSRSKPVVTAITHLGAMAA